MIKFSRSTINNIYLGNTNINKVYFGSKLIFEKENIQQVLYEFTKELETIYNTIEYSVKSAILKGQTLVNVVSEQRFGGNSLLYESRFYDKPFNAGETFTVFVVNPNISTIKIGKHNVSDGRWSGETEYDVSINKKVTFTVPVDKISKYVGVIVDNPMDSTGFENGLIIVRGDKTHLNIDTYFDGMQSVKIPVLTTVGKNIFDKTKIIFDKVIDYNTGDISDYPLSNMTEFIKVIPNTQYTMSFNFETRAWTRCFGLTEAEHGKYATDVNGISDKCYFDSNSKKITFTTSPTTKYLIFMFGKGVEESFQLEQGSTATPYESYKSNILTVNEDVTLRSNGDICDELNLLTGQLTQRIGEDDNILDQEIIRTVNLIITDQDGNNVSTLKTFNDITHIIVKSNTNALPTVKIGVAFDSNSVQAVSDAQNTISSEQYNIEEKINNQSQDTETTMIGVTEVYEKSIE